MNEDEIEYATSVDVNIAILREISKIRFRERLPLIMTGVAKALQETGVDFSRVGQTKLVGVTNEEIDQIYEDLF